MTDPPTTDRGTLFDLPFETARERISNLHASASASPGTATSAVATTAHRAPMRRLRSAVGSRLMEFGSALMAEDGVPRSATRT